MAYRNGNTPPNALKWTPVMLDFLVNNFNSMSNTELASALGLKLTSTRTKLYSLGLKRMELEYWTEEQISFLKQNYKDIGDVELAEIFNKKWKKKKDWTLKHIEKKRKYLALKRRETEVKAIHQRNVDNGRFLICVLKRWIVTGVADEFEVRMWREQKGRLTPRIKINGKFTSYARYKWEKHHGSIPKGMNIIFQDNNPYNWRLKNLLMVSNSELSLRNSKISSVGLSDNYVAYTLSYKDAKLRSQVLAMPELLELKRNKLLIDREIKKNEQTQKSSGNDR